MKQTVDVWQVRSAGEVGLCVKSLEICSTGCWQRYQRDASGAGGQMPNWISAGASEEVWDLCGTCELLFLSLPDLRSNFMSLLLTHFIDMLSPDFFEGGANHFREVQREETSSGSGLAGGH